MYYERIPDEEQLFDVGDTALLGEEKVTITFVHEAYVYYEARPIASYRAFNYSVVDTAGKKRYVETKDLRPES